MIQNRVQHPPQFSRRRGAILIIALVVTATLTGMVLALGQEMRVEAQAAANRAAAAQADEIERGAEQYVIGLLTNPDDPTIAPTDLPEDQFDGVQLGSGYFWIVRPDYDDDTLPVFGLTDEGAKINLNASAQVEWLNLLQDDSDTMSAIVSWRNRSGSASTEDDIYYSSLADPYVCKHSPFETVEELLMVRNITRQWLFGDGTAPPLGMRIGATTPPSSTNILTDAQLSRGLYDLLTVSSIEPTNDPDGNPLVKLNNWSSLKTLLTNQFSAAQADAVGKLFKYKGRGANPPTDVFDLYARGKLTAQQIDQIADYISAPVSNQQNANQPAYSTRINVDTAPPAVLYMLMGINGLSSDDIDKIIAARQANPPQAGAISWVADAIGKQHAVGLGRYLTARSYQFSADIVAASGNGRAFKHVRIIVDASGVSTGNPAQIVYRRDLTDRGWPMDPQILASLRAGQGIGTSGANFNQSGGTPQ